MHMESDNAFMSVTNNSQTTLLGTATRDIFDIETSKIYVDGLTGNDEVNANSSKGELNINTGKGNDTINFSAEIIESSLNLGEGSDTFNMQDFSGSIYGGSGSDTINIQSGRTITDTIIRGDGGKDHFNFHSVPIQSSIATPMMMIF